MECNVCENKIFELIEVKNRAWRKTYYQCNNCEFIFIDKQHILSPKAELERYSMHNNKITDVKYRAYFINFLDYIKHEIKTTDLILDYGSGPEPVLSNVLQSCGYNFVDIYDKFFFNKKNYLFKSYDIIIATEVLEHIYNPMKVIFQLLENLRNGGKLIFMTLFSPKNSDEFKKWWYIQDPTHIVFYKKKTFEVISIKYKLSIVLCNEKNIIILKKGYQKNQ